MNDFGYFGLLIVMVNLITTYLGLKNESVIENYSLNIESILIKKDFKRFITSGFLHLNWINLFLI
ncbi:MAG: hypothetical protein HQ463_01800 [Bacteroidetes bacterium]|nr:hypothetical protein [Bacteroidota bacterium]